MRQITGNSRKVSGANVSLPEFRIYWPHAHARAKRLNLSVEAVLSVRSGLKGNGNLLGLILSTRREVVAMTCDGKEFDRTRTVGAAVDQLLKWKS